MKWTSEKIEELGRLAPIGIGAAGIADILGTTRSAVLFVASTRKISIQRKQKKADILDIRDIRERWSRKLGPMKAALRADIMQIISTS